LNSTPRSQTRRVHRQVPIECEIQFGMYRKGRVKGEQLLTGEDPQMQKALELVRKL
jgi:hypothetical protein